MERLSLEVVMSDGSVSLSAGATDQFHRCRISEGLYEAICEEIKAR
jgi:hypothetical protein